MASMLLSTLRPGGHPDLSGNTCCYTTSVQTLFRCTPLIGLIHMERRFTQEASAVNVFQEHCSGGSAGEIVRMREAFIPN